jgi:two-component system, NtrC family, sensor kinase
MQLCGAASGTMFVNDEEQARTVAAWGVPAAYAEFRRDNPVSTKDPGSFAGRIFGGELFVHTLDLMEDDRYRSGDRQRRAIVDLGGARTSLYVPLRRDRDVLGAIHIYRQEVRPFTDKQIALLQNFAAQAVIAMENARLITETREALEQQTATAEVLQVINFSPGNLAPVFDAILDKAHSLCGAARGTLFLFNGESFRAAAVHGYPEELAECLRQGVSVSQTSVFAPLLAGARLVHNPDLTQIDDPIARAVAKRGGVRTNLLLPLRKDGVLLGLISCNRLEVRPFTDKQTALLENFAAQAVIVMENARLLNELRERTEDVMRREAELRVTFDNMADGVVMFDGDMRLTAWNRNFQQILHLPDAFLAERASYAEYFRHLAERGEFGAIDVDAELRRYQENVGRQCSSERTRPDGQVIEVRNNPVPGGGDLQRHYRAQTGRGPASRRPRCRGSDAARIEDGTSEPDPCRKDGLARPADRRHRARDQEPVQFRQ